MTEWRAFVNKKGRDPGEIDNLDIKNKILQRRLQKNNPESD